VRTGAEYREALRDGRKVWLLGTGPIDDVTTHPLTKGMVDAYVKWYDRHFDPQWQDIVLTPPDKTGERRPGQRAAVARSQAPQHLRFALRPVFGAALGVTGLLRQRGALVEQLDDAVVERVDARADFFQRVVHGLIPFDPQRNVDISSLYKIAKVVMIPSYRRTPVSSNRC